MEDNTLKILGSYTGKKVSEIPKKYKIFGMSMKSIMWKAPAMVYRIQNKSNLGKGYSLKGERKYNIESRIRKE